MAQVREQADIHIAFDHDFERRWIHFERWVWGAFTCLLVIGLLGILGRGPLAKTVAHTADHAVVTYERVARYRTPTVIDIRMPAVNGFAELRLDANALKKLGFRQILPPPSKSMGSDEMGPLLFQAGDDKSVLLQLTFEPVSVGPITSRLQLNNDSFMLKQFVVP